MITNLTNPSEASRVNATVVTEIDQNLVNVLRTLDLFWTFILPSICVFGMVTNVFNIVVFTRPELKDQIYKYLLFSSVIDFMYLLGCFLFAFPYCGSYCSPDLSKSYIAKWIELYIDDYLTSCLAICNILIEIAVSFQRYLVVSNAKYCVFFRNCSAYIVCTIILLVSLVYYSPEAIFLRIVPEAAQNDTNGKIYYEKVQTEYSERTNILYEIETALQVTRGFVCFAIIIFINVLIWIRFRAHIEKKMRMKGASKSSAEPTAVSVVQATNGTMASTSTSAAKSNETRAQRNITLMVLAMVVLFAFGLSPYMLVYVLKVVFGLKKSDPATWYRLYMFAQFMLLGAHGSYIFVYFHFNTVYKSTFLRLFKLK